MRGLKEAGWERWGVGVWGEVRGRPSAQITMQQRRRPAPVVSSKHSSALFTHDCVGLANSSLQDILPSQLPHPPTAPPAPPPREHHCWSSLLELTAAAHWTRGSPQSESDGRKRRQEAVTRGNYFISCSFPLLQVSTKKECTILTTGGRGEGEGVSKGLLSPSLPPARFSINSAGIKGDVCCEEKGKKTTHKQQQRGRSHVSRVKWAKSWRWT